MKKTVLILLLAGLSTILQAGPVTPEKALKVAERVLSAQPATKASSPLRIIWDGETATTKADAESPAFYVVGRDGGGFVIVAGNDNVRPVLALSYTNRFQVEDMPCNVSAWMNKIKRYSNGISEATPEVRSQWEMFEQTKGEIIKEGITGIYFPKNTPTVEWDQREPGNLILPTASGDTERAVSGCVAIAVAQIMTWFKHPASGQGTVNGYNSSITFDRKKYYTCTIPQHTLGVATDDGWNGTYDWDGLHELTDYQKFRAASGTPLEKDAAHLVYDIGTILQLNYSSIGTGGTVDRAAKLSDHMGYSKSAIELWKDREMFPDWKWNEILKEQVQDHPLYYSGSDPYDGGGHAYVLDGYGYYNGALVFHFNFGWDGLCNGYYSSDYQAPSDEDYIAEHPDAGFGEYHDVTALIDFVPDLEGTSQYVSRIKFIPYQSNSGFRATSITSNLLQYTFYDATLYGTGPVTANLAVFKLDNNGNISGNMLQDAETETFSLNHRTSFGWGFNYSSGSMSFGDKVAMFYKEGNSEYKKVDFENPSYGLSEIPFFPAAFIKTETSYAQNDFFYFRLTNHDITYPNAVWSITDPSNNTVIYHQDDDRVKLTQKGKYKIKVTPVQGGETIVTVINVN